MKPTLDILICTFGERIARIPELLPSQHEGIRYIISWQTGDHSPNISVPLSSSFTSRQDVKIFQLQGEGLSRNRNNALSHSNSDLCLIADDDCRYTNERLLSIIDIYQKYTDFDIICFEAQDLEGCPLKRYPTTPLSYARAIRQGYYVSSFEITLKRKNINDIRFNEHFGLGSEYLKCGEEDIFITDCLRQGLNVLFIPQPICTTSKSTTGSHFLTDIKVQRSKGATFRYQFGRTGGLWHCLKESLHHLVYNRMNPLPLLKNMLWGYGYCQSFLKANPSRPPRSFP